MTETAKPIAERVASLETGSEACKKQQDERHKELMGRIKRIEDRYVWILGTIVVVLLGVVAQIIISLK